MEMIDRLHNNVNIRAKLTKQSSLYCSLMRFLFLGLVMLITSCENTQQYTPNELKVAVVPDQNHEDLKNQHQPLVDYLSKELSIPAKLIIPKDYADLNRLFHERKVDLAYFGGLTFVRASEKSNAIPLTLRDIDLRFTSIFLTSKNNKGSSIKDFQGMRLSFGSQLSTSGHLMPRHFLNEQGISAEHYFSETHFSGAHDKTVFGVLRNESDLGVANNAVVESMFKKGTVNPGDFKIIWITPPYPDYVWAIQPDVEPEFTTRLLNAFLSLTTSHKESKSILDSQSAGGFLPARDQDFDQLRNIAKKLNLLN